MGLKDIMINKMLSKMLGGIDMKAIANDAQNGKYDVNKMKQMLDGIIGQEASNAMISKIQKKIASGEKMSMSMIMDLIKSVDINSLTKRAKNGDVRPEKIDTALSTLLGKAKAEKIFQDAQRAVQEIQDEEQ